MTLDEIDSFCRNLPGCEVRYPFGEEIRTWTVNRKMFAWTSLGQKPTVIQLKVDPDLLPSLIENYASVRPGYHMNKRHWVSVDSSACDDAMLRELLEDAHQLIVQALPKREQLRLLTN